MEPHTGRTAIATVMAILIATAILTATAALASASALATAALASASVTAILAEGTATRLIQPHMRLARIMCIVLGAVIIAAPIGDASLPNVPRC